MRRFHIILEKARLIQVKSAIMISIETTILSELTKVIYVSNNAHNCIRKEVGE
jgi:hypothetical protein